MKDKFKIKTTKDNRDVAKSDIVFLAVKPQVIDSVLEDISGTDKSNCMMSLKL